VSDHVYIVDNSAENAKSLEMIDLKRKGPVCHLGDKLQMDKGCRLMFS
jgi:hypothetical protein